MSTPGTRAVSRICRNNPVEPVYDLAGNMTDDKFQYLYTYDACNRLVKVEDQGVTPAVVGAYAYDGLNRRITRTIGSDDAIHEYYTESWQRIESRPGGESSTQGVSLFVFGIRYIDDIVMRQRDANASGPPEERRYYLTDANYNVSMIVTDAGYGVERIFYTAYGEPEVFPFGDADGDYQVHSTIDLAAITAIKNGSQPYNILADLNLDGAVTQADLNAFSAYSGALGGRNVLTASNGSATTGNDIGYAGYTWNDERSQWHVRHREYDPKMGRFLQRDPSGYVDGPALYRYSLSNPVRFIDPSGRSPRSWTMSQYPPAGAPYRGVPRWEGDPTERMKEDRRRIEEERTRQRDSLIEYMETICDTLGSCEGCTVEQCKEEARQIADDYLEYLHSLEDDNGLGQHYGDYMLCSDFCSTGINALGRSHSCWSFWACGWGARGDNDNHRFIGARHACGAAWEFRLDPFDYDLFGVNKKGAPYRWLPGPGEHSFDTEPDQAPYERDPDTGRPMRAPNPPAFWFRGKPPAPLEKPYVPPYWPDFRFYTIPF